MRTFEPTTDVLDYEFEYNTAETEQLHDLLNRKLTPTIDDLRRVSLWKIDRVIAVDDETLELLGKLAAADVSVDSDLSRDCLTCLVECQGVGFPMASAILKFLRPDVFPIIDARAYRALYGKKLYSSSYTLERYLAYANRIGDIARQLSLELREVDEQLYCFDKAQNGKL